MKESIQVISKKFLLAIGLSALLAFGVAACGDDDDDDSGETTTTEEGLSGSIAIDGSSTVQPFAEAAAEFFAESNPDVSITVGAAGTGGGFEKFCAGETDISNASRPIDPKEEVPLCKDGGVEYTEIQVANDGIAIATNPGLEISCLTTDQLKQLWVDDKVTNYSELGNDADTGEPLPDADVSLYGPGTDSGTFDYFTDVINGEEGVSRKEYQPSEDDN
jgi:phosphate transport system substrate-binding protein